MRQLDHAQRHDLGQPARRRGDGRRGARDEQDGAADEHQQRQAGSAASISGPAPSRRADPRRAPAADGRRAGRRPQQQRQHVVDQPIGDQRRGDAGGWAPSGSASSSTASNTPSPAGTWLITPDAGRREDAGEGEEADASSAAAAARGSAPRATSRAGRAAPGPPQDRAWPFPYRGAVVLGVSDEEVQEVLIPIRLTLERYSFVHAATRMTDADFAELGKEIWVMERAAQGGRPREDRRGRPPIPRRRHLELRAAAHGAGLAHDLPAHPRRTSSATAATEPRDDGRRAPGAPRGLQTRDRACVIRSSSATSSSGRPPRPRSAPVPVDEGGARS